MNSRPLLDYLAFPDDTNNQPEADHVMSMHSADSLAARLREIEARLNANAPAPAAPSSDLTLSAQIEAILSRKAGLASARPDETETRHREMSRPARVALDPPPSVPVANDAPAVDQEFARFTEAVYLIGQAARRFIDHPEASARVAHRPEPVAPSAGDIDALSAVLRETVSAFRSVADDLAVSAGEIRHYATRHERQPERPAGRHRGQPTRYSDDDEILELRENIAELQHRLDDLLHARRRARY